MMMKIRDYFVILLVLCGNVQSITTGEIEQQKVFEFFSSQIIQIRHIIQTPIKTIIPFLGIVSLSTLWFHYRGELYRMYPGTIFVYNIQYSTTWAAQQSIKALGYVVIFTILSYIFAEKLEEVDVAATNAIARQRRSLTSSLEEGSFTADVVLPACNQLFQTQGIVKDFLLTVLGVISKWIFWAICHIVLPPLPAPGRYFW